MLTIVHLVFSSRIAGGEQHCIDLAHAQAALGHNVHVIGPRGSAIEQALRTDVTYHGLAWPVMRAVRSQRIVRALQADVCHAHLGPACKVAAKLRGCVRVGTLHVGFKAHQHAALDGLICVNQAQQEHLSEYAGRRRVIYNWAPERAPVGTGISLRTELGLHDSQLLIGAVGRLHPSKGMDTLVSAFRAHAPKNAVLAVLGEGKDLARLQLLAAGDPRIRFLGFRQDVDAALSSMDLFVSPSREEAFPLAVLEAMRAGLPIVGTATQGLREMFAGHAEVLVPIGDADALGSAIARRLQPLQGVSRERRTPMAYDVKRYDRTQAVRDVLEFYGTLLPSVGIRQGPIAEDSLSEEEMLSA